MPILKLIKIIDEKNITKKLNNVLFKSSLIKMYHNKI